MGGNVCAYGASNRPGTVHHMGNTTCHPGFLIYLSGSLWKFPPGRYRSGSTATAVDPHWTASCLGIWALPFSWRIHGVDPLGCRRYVDTLHAGHSCVAPDRHWANRTTTGIPPLRAHPLWTGRVMGSHHVWLVWSVWAVFCKSYPLFPSNIINQQSFNELFGFPIQMFRAVTAVAAATFVIRFLRAFQVEAERKIADLQQARLEESQQREIMRGELFRRVVAAQESERQRIARDLHDETGQSLTAIGMGLRGLSGKLGPRSKEAIGTLHTLETLTADSLKELQRLISDLRPSHLDDLGLSAALRWYAGKIQEHSTLNIRVDIVGEEHDLDDAIKITIFRIIQESLNNIIKHAQATHVNIYLSFEKKNVRINVQDNGIGFDIGQLKQRPTKRPSLGLAGMEERAALLDGTVTVQSRPGYGTNIEALIPYHHAGSNDLLQEVKDDHTPV